MGGRMNEREGKRGVSGGGWGVRVMGGRMNEREGKRRVRGCVCVSMGGWVRGERKR